MRGGALRRRQDPDPPRPAPCRRTRPGGGRSRRWCSSATAWRRTSTSWAGWRASSGSSGVRAFLFHEGRDPGAERAFQHIAELTRGACFPLLQRLGRTTCARCWAASPPTLPVAGRRWRAGAAAPAAWSSAWSISYAEPMMGYLALGLAAFGSALPAAAGSSSHIAAATSPTRSRPSPPPSRRWPAPACCSPAGFGLALVTLARHRDGRPCPGPGPARRRPR